MTSKVLTWYEFCLHGRQRTTKLCYHLLLISVSTAQPWRYALQYRTRDRSRSLPDRPISVCTMLYVVVTAHNSISGVSNGYYGSHSLQHKFGPSDNGFYDDYLEVRKLTPCRGGGRSFVMVRPKGEGMGPPKGVPKRGVRGTSPGKIFENQP